MSDVVLTPAQQAAASAIGNRMNRPPQLPEASRIAPAKPASRVFYTRMLSSTFYVQLRDLETGALLPGQTEKLQFVKDRLELTDPSHIKQVAAAADRPGSPIYTKQEDAHHVPADDQLAVQEVIQRAGDVVEAIAKSGQHVA